MKKIEQITFLRSLMTDEWHYEGQVYILIPVEGKKKPYLLGFNSNYWSISQELLETYLAARLFEIVVAPH